MTRVVVVAGSGAAHARLTAAVSTVPGAFIVRHGSCAAPLDRLLALMAPDLILVTDLLTPDQGLARLAEMRRAAPAADVVVLTAGSDTGWLSACGNSLLAILPADLDPAALGRMLCDALGAGSGATHRLSLDGDAPVLGAAA